MPGSESMPPDEATASRTLNGFGRVLSVQRPAVLAHIRGIRRRNPNATPAEIAAILERRYVATVATGGAAVGATAVIPGVGTGITLALSGAETAGFLEASALFAQSLSELHGISAADPQRSSALVMTMMLGDSGSALVRQFVGQASGSGPSRSQYWGQQVMSSLPQMAVRPLVDRVRQAFVRRFAASGTASIMGRALPFGVGAAVGGFGNYTMARKVIHNSRRAFGPTPLQFPAALELEHVGPTIAVRGASAVTAAAGRGARAVQAISTRTTKTLSATGQASRAITRGTTDWVGQKVSDVQATRKKKRGYRGT